MSTWPSSVGNVRENPGHRARARARTRGSPFAPLDRPCPCPDTPAPEIGAGRAYSTRLHPTSCGEPHAGMETTRGVVLLPPVASPPYNAPRTHDLFFAGLQEQRQGSMLAVQVVPHGPRHQKTAHFRKNAFLAPKTLYRQCGNTNIASTGRLVASMPRQAPPVNTGGSVKSIIETHKTHPLYPSALRRACTHNYPLC